jgi:hypothetical protein
MGGKASPGFSAASGLTEEIRYLHGRTQKAPGAASLLFSTGIPAAASISRYVLQQLYCFTFILNAFFFFFFFCYFHDEMIGAGPLHIRNLLVLVSPPLFLFISILSIWSISLLMSGRTRFLSEKATGNRRCEL